MATPTRGGSRTDFGALLVGYYEQGTLRYAGKVGTGFPGRAFMILAFSYGSWRYPSQPLSTFDRFPEVRIGQDPSWSFRLHLPSGRATHGYVNRAFLGSATTSAR